ncbi:hypothetical protein JYU34_022210 [Plutella xylostella]|uniref:Follicular epithelium yolk protein subunit n=1 Tax=Plutella xylostella TaxID=51655 RepID=A0ABQ7PUA8_PLUXY|nr:hypothetical protein JYU34_022210 [Plutella xylostella]
MASYFLFLLLPALAVAKINIEIFGTMTGNENDLQVKYSGSDVSVISDVERATYKINDGQLKNAIQAYFGKRPDDAFMRSPTPWGDLYRTYGWSEVTRTLRPKSARVLKIAANPEILLEQVFENNSTKPATFNVGISQSVQNTISSSWSKGGDLTVSQEINYGFDIKAVSFGGSTSFSYSSSWGYNSEKSESVTVGSSASMELLLLPGQSVRAQLHATRGKALVEVEYEASLSGAIAVNYDKGYRGHHYWSLPVGGVMSSGQISNNIVSKEVIEIGYFSNAKVVVHDRAMGTKMLDINL